MSVELSDCTPTMQYESIQDAELTVGGGAGGAGREVPETIYALNIAATICDGGPQHGQVVYVQLWLTVPQMAQIVKEFFGWLFLGGQQNIYRELLKRLLGRRWATMTASTVVTLSTPETEAFNRYRQL